MAAGRSGGYRDAEFIDRDSGYNFPRRDLYFKDNGDRNRNGKRIHDEDVIERDRDLGRIRQKDTKQRDSVSGSCRFISRNDSDEIVGAGRGHSLQYGHSPRVVDREPGELSSESGSEGAVGSDSQAKDDEVSNMDGKHYSPATRKRKFSPIIWDRDDKEVGGFVKSNVVPTTVSRAPSHILNSENPSSIVSQDDGQILEVETNYSHDSSPLTELDNHHPLNNVSSGLLENLHCESPSDHQWGNDDVATQEQREEDLVTTRNISASRWAGDVNSPVDDDDNMLDEEDMLKRRKHSLRPDIVGTRMRKRSSSPEPGEFKSEDCVALRPAASDIFGGLKRRPSCEGPYLDNNLENNDHMEVDDEIDKNRTRLSLSDTDSEQSSLDATPEPQAPPPRTVNMLQGCRSVDEFERLNKIDEGTYGVVYRAKDKKTGEIVALKKVKMEKEREGFPMTSLREINILLSFHHPSVVDVKEVVVGSSLDSIFMVMEYMEHDLKGLMESMKQPFSQSEVKCLMLQLFEGCKYLHDNWVLHRDLKTSNLLLNNQGELKICDFGLARQYGSPLKPYTHMVVTLWYRAPELLLGAKQYSTAIDMWSLGCIMAELLSKEPLFNGKSEFDQLDKIFRILGTPNETIWPGFSKLPGVKVNFVKHQYNQLRKKFPATSFTGSPVLSDAGFDLLNRLLTFDPEKRITADEALKHEWFCEVPLPKSKEFMPTFPAQHAQDRRMRRVMKSPDPLEEQQRRELRQAELGTGGLFG